MNDECGMMNAERVGGPPETDGGVGRSVGRRVVGVTAPGAFLYGNPPPADPGYLPI